MRIIISLMLCFVLVSCNKKDDELKKLTQDIKDQQQKVEQQKKEVEELLKKKDSGVQKVKDDYDKALDDYNKAGGKYPGKYPFTSSKQLTDDELKGLSDKDLKIMKNEILARHGFIFHDKEMKEYFSQQSWYNPKYDKVDDLLLQQEKLNIVTIEAFEKSKK